MGPMADAGEACKLQQGVTTEITAYSLLLVGSLKLISSSTSGRVKAQKLKLPLSCSQNSERFSSSWKHLYS